LLVSTFDKGASGPQNLVEVLEGRLEKGLLMVDSGVIHQDGHGAEPLFHRPGKLFRTPGVRHVTGKVPGPVSQLFSSGSQQIYPAPGKNSHVSHLEPASVVRNLGPHRRILGVAPHAEHRPVLLQYLGRVPVPAAHHGA
jgi:hypothetical protein